ncbi:hypothetical protein C4K04_2059 [Pseudomonas chlororaphis]|jgi:hypothetical protein|uniref:Uncharacterized protein n=1 Tax=Pseudomonas chlororaphis TaxID=587753 RepID=A0A3G7TKX5_9PSED|nr:hypothetical protein [Pseudomonas chlororaphis]AZE47743.1 hypothetical protein C4K04_2059 [Pseudomonas chlororaphis]
MFETYEAARLPALPSFERDTTRWAFIAQADNREWFYVTHQYLQDGDPECVCSQQFMIPDVIGLMSLVQSSTNSAFVSEVQLVSPGWLNASARWRMEPLNRLIAVPCEEGRRYTYEVAGGAIYSPQFEDTGGVGGTTIWSVAKGGVPNEPTS